MDIFKQQFKLRVLSKLSQKGLDLMFLFNDEIMVLVMLLYNDKYPISK